MKPYQDEGVLSRLYIDEGKSVLEVAEMLNCSQHHVNYWLHKHHIPKRSISEAIYKKRNPKGDPFCFKKPETAQEVELFGLGIGLYWGEGNRANKGSIRLGNSDPVLIKTFMHFLEEIFMAERSRMHFQLQIYDDVDLHGALEHWSKKLEIKASQWSKPVITHSIKPGTYLRRSQYGVVMLSYHNIKLRNLLMSFLAEKAGLESTSQTLTATLQKTH